MNTYHVFYYDSLGRKCDLSEEVAENAQDAKNQASKLLLSPERTALKARCDKRHENPGRPLSSESGPLCASCSQPMRPNGHNSNSARKWRCHTCKTTATDSTGYKRGEVGKGRPKI